MFSWVLSLILLAGSYAVPPQPHTTDDDPPTDACVVQSGTGTGVCT